MDLEVTFFESFFLVSVFLWMAIVEVRSRGVFFLQVKLSSVRQSTVRMLDVPRVHRSFFFVEANLKLPSGKLTEP